MKINGIAHTGITVNNLEKSMEFYCGVLGFQVINAPCDMVTDNEEGLAMLGMDGVLHRICLLEVVPGQYIELVEFGEPKTITEQPMPLNNVGAQHISLEVDNIKEWIACLTEKGMTFNYKALPYETEKGTAWWIFFKDPDGIAVELMQP